MLQLFGYHTECDSLIYHYHMSICVRACVCACVCVFICASLMIKQTSPCFSPFPPPSLLSCPLLTDGCPNLCNGNGQCTMGQQSWHCECQTGWRGPGCSVAMETSCADNKDNEGGEFGWGGVQCFKNSTSKICFFKEIKGDGENNKLNKI